MFICCKTAGPASSAVDCQTNIFVSLVIFVLLLSGLVQAQVAAFVSISQVPETDTANLSFEQPSPPINLAGVEFYVVVEGSDPTISLHVPQGSWMFEEGETYLFVGEPTEKDGRYSFPVTAWREDNDAQSGSGLFLQVVCSDGIVIAVEDFPTKNAPSTTTQLQPGPATLAYALMQASKVQVTDIQGHDLVVAGQGDPTELFAQAWKALPQGVYIVAVTMLDHTVKVWKVVRQ